LLKGTKKPIVEIPSWTSLRSTVSTLLLQLVAAARRNLQKSQKTARSFC